MGWLAGRLKTHLLSRYSGGEKVEDFTFLDIDELALGVLPRKGGPHAVILAARLIDRGEPIRIKTGKHDIRINIRDSDTSRAFKRSVLVGLLELLIEEGSESSEKISSPRGDIEVAVRISSYAFFGKDVVVGSSKEAVEASRTAFSHEQERVSSSAPYREIGQRLFTPPSDLRVFVDNRGDNFKRYIALCRADWGRVLLSMAESVDYLGVAADIIDSDSMRATILAHSVDETRARTTQAVVKANLPLFLKRYLGGSIDHIIKIERDGLYVTVLVNIKGLRDYWDGLFEVKEKAGDG